MKQLTCEMCGSTDLMKQDGVFVCQTCGTKYSVEEARKMMVEGTVEVAGTVQVANTAQISNLLTMAHSAFDSKNYAKAEEFCNQVISMDDRNYEAWKLKGESINYQISATNPRILEVYNCIMTAFRISVDNLDDDPDVKEIQKNVKILEILPALKECMEGEVDFWIKQFEAGRPTDAALDKVKSVYMDCYNKMKAAYEEIGLESEVYLKNFDNYFCERCNSTCVSAWKTTVAYNYFRDDLKNLGKNWNRTSGKKEYISSDVYRPNEEIRTTFVTETDNMRSLLKYCTRKFNDLTDPKTKENIYANIAYFCRAPIDQCSYKAMVSTTTNGYGAVISQREYYQIHFSLTDSAKQKREAEAKSYDAKKMEAIEEGKKKKIAEYWEEHPEEKEKLESEKKDLETRLKALKLDLENITGEEEIDNLQKQIDAMTEQKNSLGLFKGKEKKALQEQIDDCSKKIAVAKKQFEDAKAPIVSAIDPLQKRLDEINTELEKER